MLRFGSVHSEGVAGGFYGSADSKGFRNAASEEPRKLRVHKGHPLGDGNCAEATDAKEFRSGVMCRVVSSSGRERK